MIFFVNGMSSPLCGPRLWRGEQPTVPKFRITGGEYLIKRLTFGRTDDAIQNLGCELADGR
jgi:hypothetical protein